MTIQPWLTSYKNLTCTRDLIDNRPQKNGPVGKTGPQGPNTLSFVSCHLKDNVEVIHFHLKKLRCDKTDRKDVKS